MNFPLLAMIISGVAVLTSSITTTHQDNPGSIVISFIDTSTKAKMRTNQSLVATNITLPVSERQKRLLPYQNFYFNQPIHSVQLWFENHCWKDLLSKTTEQPSRSYDLCDSHFEEHHQNGGIRTLFKCDSQRTSHVEFSLARPLRGSENIIGPYQAGVSAQQHRNFASTWRPIKKTEFKSVNNSPPVDTVYQSGQKFTPFSENNAIPGPFRPIEKNKLNTPSEAKYILVENHVLEKDEESNGKDRTSLDLPAIYEKLAQLKLRQEELRTSYGSRLQHQLDFQDKPQRGSDFGSFYEVPRYNIQPSKTTIESYRATNIDISEENGDDQYELLGFSQTPSPTKQRIPIPVRPIYPVSQKSFIHHQIANKIPESSLSLTLTPNTVKKPGSKNPPKTYYLLQQNVLGSKQSPFILKRPKPSIIVDEHFVAEKFVPVFPQKTDYYSSRRPIYRPYEAQYHSTPTPLQPQHHELQPLDNEPYGDEAPPKINNLHTITSDFYQFQTMSPGSVPSSFELNQRPIQKNQDHIDIVKGLPEDVKSKSLAHILKLLQDNNSLPQTLTIDNIDNSLKTLVKILNTLKAKQEKQKPMLLQDEYEYSTEAGINLTEDLLDKPDGGTPGTPGVDYPALSSIPKTIFKCKTQRYKGFFGDPDTNCQVWHYCDLNGGQASFLCPNGTIFSQVALTCDWWYNVKCASTAQLYVLNERLYKYIIPLSPKFPEDYSGPLVDKYLAMKFQEMEARLRKQKKGKGNADSQDAIGNGNGDTNYEEAEQKENTSTEAIDTTTEVDLEE